jgi:hypothetical protein
VKPTVTIIPRRHITKFPKFWIPNVDAHQALDAKLVHWDLVTRFTDGTATVVDLWDWIETGLTYLKTMQILAKDGLAFTDDAQVAVAEQLAMYEAVIDNIECESVEEFDLLSDLTDKAQLAIDGVAQ